MLKGCISGIVHFSENKITLNFWGESASMDFNQDLAMSDPSYVDYILNRLQIRCEIKHLKCRGFRYFCTGVK